MKLQIRERKPDRTFMRSHTLLACCSNLEVNNIFPIFTAATVISLEEQTTLQWHSGDEGINHHTKTVGAGVSADEKEYGWESHRKETKDTLRNGYGWRGGWVRMIYLSSVSWHQDGLPWTYGKMLDQEMDQSPVSLSRGLTPPTPPPFLLCFTFALKWRNEL